MSKSVKDPIDSILSAYRYAAQGDIDQIATANAQAKAAIIQLIDEAYNQGVDDLSEAITSQLPPISAWDGQEARDNSLVHKLVKNAVAELATQQNDAAIGYKEACADMARQVDLCLEQALESSK